MTYLFIMLAGIAGITKNGLRPGRKPAPTCMQQRVARRSEWIVPASLSAWTFAPSC